MTYEELRANVRDHLYSMSVAKMEREHALSLQQDDLVRAMYIREYIDETERADK